MRPSLISLALLTAFVPVLAVESSASLVFERKGSIWYHENEPFSDCRKARRSLICEYIKNEGKPDKISSCSIDLLSSLAAFKSPSELIAKLTFLDKKKKLEILKCARAADWPDLADIVKALCYAHTLPNLTDIFAMNACLDDNPGNEYEPLKHAYWLGWEHFEKFAAEMSRELNFESLTLVLDAMGNDNTKDFVVTIPTSFCSKRDIFFLIGLKSAAELESRLSELDTQRQFEIFQCADYTNWIHLSTFIHGHKFIVDYHPDPILSMILNNNDPELGSMTAQLEALIVKYRWVKEVVVGRNLNTIEKIINFYRNNETLTLILLPFIPDRLVIDLGACNDKPVSSFCTMHLDKDLYNLVLIMLIKETKCRFRISVRNFRYLHEVLGSHFINFLTRSQIKIFNLLRDPRDLFGNVLTLTVPIVIDEITEPTMRGENYLEYAQFESVDLDNFQKVIRIKNLNIGVWKLQDVVREQVEILSVVDEISVKVSSEELVFDKVQKPIQIIKELYPRILIKLEEIKIGGWINENYMNKFIEGLELFSEIKVVKIDDIYPYEREKIEASARVIQRLAQIHPKVDMLKIWSRDFEFSRRHFEFFDAIPKFRSLRLTISDFISLNLRLFLGKVAPKLTQLEIILYTDVKLILDDMPNSWPLITNLTMHADNYFNTSKSRMAILTGLQMPNLETVTVVREVGGLPDRRIMTKEEYLSMKC